LLTQEPTVPTYRTYVNHSAWRLYQPSFFIDKGIIVGIARQFVRGMVSKSRNERTSLLGGEHEEVINSTGILGRAYWLDGRWKKAEQLLVQVMETSKMKLGADHPHTLTSMVNLAFTLESLGHDAEAINLLRNC
jgi:hypothetical protein